MKKLQILLGVILITLSTTSWAFLGLFSSYSDEEKVKDLSQAMRWMIESGVDIYATEGEAALKKHLKTNISEKLRDNIDLDLIVNVFDNKREILGGGVFGVFTQGRSGLFESSAKVVYRKEINGEYHEFWEARVKNQTENYKILDFKFLVVKVIKGTEKRLILHESDRFFDEFEVTAGHVLELPIDERALLDVLQPGVKDRRPYFIGTSLENVRLNEVNGKYQYVKVDLAQEKLKERQTKMKRMRSLAWVLPIEGISIYEKYGLRYLKDGIEKSGVESAVVESIKINPSAYKKGMGKAFSFEGDGVTFGVYLVSRQDVDGSLYEYWFLDGIETDLDTPIKRVVYFVAKVDPDTGIRDSLHKSEEAPIASYTTKSGTVIEFPPVDKGALE
jgi:hypothetical protein